MSSAVTLRRRPRSWVGSREFHSRSWSGRCSRTTLGSRGSTRPRTSVYPFRTESPGRSPSPNRKTLLLHLLVSPVRLAFVRPYPRWDVGGGTANGDVGDPYLRAKPWVGEHADGAAGVQRRVEQADRGA